jgi:pimeloyl-ACP methyl ester carboxylesterase
VPRRGRPAGAAHHRGFLVGVKPKTRSSRLGRPDFEGFAPGALDASEDGAYVSPAVSARAELFTVPALRGVRLRALHWGDPAAPLVVLLHGGGANAHWWDHVAPALARSHRVVALDFRGHGDSDWPEETCAGAFSDDLDALLEHLGSPPALLAGHSMGAHVALDRAARDPDVGGLALIDVAWNASQAERRAARRALSLRLTHPTRERAIAAFRFVPAAANAPEPLRAAVAERSVRREPDGRFGFKFDPRWFALPYRPLPPLAGVRCETLIVRGAESPLLGADAARDLAARLPRARVVDVEGAGHHVHFDRPEAATAILAEFLAKLR